MKQNTKLILSIIIISGLVGAFAGIAVYRIAYSPNNSASDVAVVSNPVSQTDSDSDFKTSTNLFANLLDNIKNLIP
ncbi:MAG TPA: hypothetical protein PLX73_02585, partial [Candidatus Paceibacterota bacterium]|nr:hypothetical protein [Candidatus Paceibacterota bacterium]HOL54242.1 hypothetical protein [Candidatus Paceibacterota bacterium]HPP17241.1 hypothetical protein [Candidatus Paceibacterota bacterium]